VSEYVYYWGLREGETWSLIKADSRVAMERCFPNQLDARRHCQGYSVWRREITDEGIGPPELMSHSA
jgi:hypothetical protein